MTDQELVRFLQEVLPDLGLRWAGFRKVRKTVGKRIARRLRELGFQSLDAYRRQLRARPEEWQRLASMCRIPISRFFRDREVFRRLERQVLPMCARDAADAGRQVIRCLSAGCASGEEPYSVNLVWLCSVADRYPALKLRILAVDAEPEMLRRAMRACYKASSLTEVPDEIRAVAFDDIGDEYQLKAAFRSGVRFERSDIRMSMPDEPFDIILCRNLAFTYFAGPIQEAVLRGFEQGLRPGGFLILGSQEDLPGDKTRVKTILQGAHVPIFRKTDRGLSEVEHGEVGKESEPRPLLTGLT